jgi:glucokinase
MRAGLMERIRPTPADVRFLNDAYGFGLGELRAGAASGHERAVVTTLGTGVGSAFLAAGSLIDDDPSAYPRGASISSRSIGDRSRSWCSLPVHEFTG